MAVFSYLFQNMAELYILYLDCNTNIVNSLLNVAYITIQISNAQKLKSDCF